MAAWLTAMVPPTGFSRQLKLDAARNWWMAGLAFYALLGIAAVYAALTESGTAAQGMATIESALIGLLLFETLMHRVTRHIVSELPMAGDVVADCVRLLVRLYVAILIAEAMMVRVLGGFDAGAMGAPRSGRQGRGLERRGDLRRLALHQVPHGLLHRRQPAALGRRVGRF